MKEEKRQKKTRKNKEMSSRRKDEKKYVQISRDEKNVCKIR